MTHLLIAILAIGGVFELFSTAMTLWLDYKTYQLRKASLNKGQQL